MALYYWLKLLDSVSISATSFVYVNEKVLLNIKKDKKVRNETIMAPAYVRMVTSPSHAVLYWYEEWMIVGPPFGIPNFALFRPDTSAGPCSGMYAGRTAGGRPSYVSVSLSLGE